MDNFYTSLQVDDEFYEEGYGETIHLRVVEPTIVTVDNDTTQYTWVAVDVDTGREIDYLITKGYEHYGPNIFQ